MRVIGVDPGPTPGIVTLMTFGDQVISCEVVQCSANALHNVLAGLYAGVADLVAVERFVVARGSMRTSRDGELTRDQVAQLLGTYDRVVLRSASEVKPWATNFRLASAELLEPTKGMRHARDAARHALFAAVKDGGLPDPLSKRRAS